MSDLFTELLSAPAPAEPIADLSDLFARIPTRGPTVERAARAGFRADRLGYAFAGAYVAAMARLDAAPAGRGAFCVTEAGGGHPRAIQTRLERRGNAYRLSGEKSFVTLGRAADTLLVVASVGREGDRNHLRVARVPTARAGVGLRDLPELPFTPEIPHSAVTFDDVEVAPSELLDGDGYTDFVKPFRTIEDVHVLAGLAGYLVSAARGYGWPRAICEALFADLAAILTIGAADPKARGVHVALGGVFAAVRARVTAVDASWELAPPEARERWRRDLPLLAIADRARAARLDAAWSGKGSP